MKFCTDGLKCVVTLLMFSDFNFIDLKKKKKIGKEKVSLGTAPSPTFDDFVTPLTITSSFASM